MGINIIAFRRNNQMDISGNVVTAEEFLQHLKVLTAPIHLMWRKKVYFADYQLKLFSFALGAPVPRWQPGFSHPHIQLGSCLILLSAFSAND